jgi:hypothetical protein
MYAYVKIPVMVSGFASHVPAKTTEMRHISARVRGDADQTMSAAILGIAPVKAVVRACA